MNSPGAPKCSGPCSLICLILLAAALLSACAPVQAARGGLVVAATTTIEDTGLLAEIAQGFDKDHPRIRLRTLALGSGEALDLGARGDADVLLVHSPADEERFMRDGFGVSRQQVMSSRFVLAAPAGDPARARGESSPSAAFAKIAAARAPFVSRGDGSGTHRAEIAIWRSTTINPSGSWYVESGQGAGETLVVAGELSAYTLSDGPTLAVMSGRVALTGIDFDDPAMLNPYHVIVAAQAAHPLAARAFADWLTSTDAQATVASFGQSRYGRPLYEPAH